jgi:hypothetical protein
VTEKKIKAFIHRKHHRVRQQVDMLVCQKSECLVLRTNDVSEGGISFDVLNRQLPQTFAVGKFVRTRAESDSEATATIGEIVRLNDQEMAIKFV